MHSSDIIDRFNDLLAEMGQGRSLDAGLRLAKLFMGLVTPTAKEIDLDEVQDSKILDVLGLGNSKMDNWFVPHPYLGGHHTAFQLFDDASKHVEAKFYQLSQRVSKRLVAGAVQLSPNWEDNSVLTQNGDWRVGIDFFLTQDARALLVVLSLEGNLRVVELSERLTSTQAGILAKVSGAGDLPTHEAVHRTLWDAFAIREVNREFYQGIAAFFDELREKLIQDKRPEEDAKLFASRLVGRLLFIWFLRRKGLIADAPAYFDATGRSATKYYDEVLKQLFFGTLNTPVKERMSVRDVDTPYLNGGLFEYHANDWSGETVRFPEGFFTRLYEHFDRFNFTTDESSPDYEQVAIDPEMLGRVFESLLATQRTETGESARKAKGTFYTPREVVAYMCKEALRQYLYTTLDNDAWNFGVDKLLDSSDAYVAQQHSNFKRDLWGRDNVKVVVPKILAAIDDLKILDPACGSGAFPLGMVHLLTRTLERLDARFDPYKTKLGIIKNSIYGVDIEPMAIEIAKLRTWLALAVEESDLKNVEPLPNLDFKFVCANSLLSLAAEHEGFDFGVDPKLDQKLADIRASYFETSSPSKKIKLKDEYHKLTHPSFASEVDLRTRQLNSFDPFKFSKPAQFFDPKQMFGIETFDIVVGNPPYIGEKGNKETFRTLAGSSIFERFYQGRADMLHYFFHLGIDVLGEGGVLVFVTTNYYPTATFGSTLRKDMASRTKILRLVNFNELKVFESALGQHNMITVLEKSTNNRDYQCHQVVANAKGAIDQKQLNEILAADSTLARNGLVPVSGLFDGEAKYIRFISDSSSIELVLQKVGSAGRPLGCIPAVSINQGIVTGIDRMTALWKRKFPMVGAPPGTPVYVFRHGEESFEHLKPWFKSSDVRPYVTAEKPSWDLLYLGRGIKPTMEETAYLTQFRPILETRREFQPNRRNALPWYELHWPREQEIFEGPKVVASYRTYNNAFAYNDKAFYAGADLTLITADVSADIDLFYLLGLLNSSLIYTWFYHRGKRKGDMLELKAVPVSEVPIARDAKLEKRIAAIAKRAHMELTKDPDTNTGALEAELDELIFGLYGLDAAEKEAVRDFAKSQGSIRKMTRPVDAEYE
ncbi:Eco57I restriction-modification methylase domain-containing protein [Rhodococcus ruber]|uniref:Eco57I restriction-modification methylase domain-containing protein n=1 Tax=Rhodococcus ruber TaxID=1830 RepID=UPI001EEE6015|nr:TaqI-like C-terminal specificity domain-containing protein [Rhodococcus ruber]MCF8783414.1 Eco57I restriction-modification methylase domain-containing protein [Rhodococcus ruber]